MYSAAVTVQLQRDRNRIINRVGRLNELARLDEQLEELDEPWLARLRTIRGVNRVTAWTLISELGVNMGQFAVTGHAAS